MLKPNTKILFIGNSFTGRNNLPSLISQLATSADRAVETGMVIANGVALKTHWDRGVALQTIQESTWDYVSLQEQSTLPLKNRARMHEYVEKFDEEIRKSGARTVLYLTWVRQNVPDRQAELTEAFTTIGDRLGAIVAPVGVAWQQVQRENPGIILYDKDGSHPSLAGSYLAACVFYAALFHQSPVGLWSQVPHLSPDEVEALQRAAETACELLPGKAIQS